MICISFSVQENKFKVTEIFLTGKNLGVQLSTELKLALKANNVWVGLAFLFFLKFYFSFIFIRLLVQQEVFSVGGGHNLVCQNCGTLSNRIYFSYLHVCVG